ncbi:AlkZ family DNA glycosylase [Dactylosporangium aurantiacum]|uniref:AlkZ family DNA glycosylase n=1 Tax=Dactylosporangium aurantiacum TaxID=35754 RepID=A0A9Q9IER6_9ACTN|nr:winged helix DNA-binding domain-containing protein [Dactylosporangium aurantiacum]MDG6102804.1 winged helix DNA-binding domain-containing protein [Dactylosporangium aurantiacum]UWZ52955.1 AlkZ family DNA glycosylase [Dactylosporangium aurantiacum]
MANVGRATVLAYRIITNQLHERVDADPGDLAVLDLGVANVPAGTARQALAARTSRFDAPLSLVWSARGARHLHRTADLPGLVTALWPISDADAAARFATKLIPDGGKLGMAAFRATAEAFAAVVTGPTSKGDASRGVSDRVPDALTYYCGPCKAQHISGAIFQQAGLAGGVQLDETAATTVLLPVDGGSGPVGVPDGPGDPSGLIHAYLRLLGPATPGDVAKYFGTTVTALRPAWPGGLAEVTVDGRAAWIPPESLDALLAAEPVRGVRLLPSSDPFLQARDRSVLTPDKAREREVWRALGNPGVLLLDGDLAGTWRAKVAGKRLAVTVAPWVPLRAPVRAAVEAEAQWLAAARGLPTAEVTVERGDT